MKKLIITSIAIAVLFITLYARTASWEVAGYNNDFRRVTNFYRVEFEYSGQNVYITGAKTVTADSLGITYTGSDTLLNDKYYAEINPIPIMGGDTVNWVMIAKTSNVELY